MERIRADLWLTSLDCTDGVNHSGFLLLRPEGNVLFYSAPGEAEFERIAALGGVGHHVLSHRHDDDPSPAGVKRAFGARLCCDAAEAAAITEPDLVDWTLEDGDDRLGSVAVHLTPGHTAGGISCTYRSPHGERYLFSGDTMIPVKDQWIAQIVPSHGGDAAVLTRTLRRLGELDPDLVVSSASVGDCVAMPVGSEQWRHAVETTAARAPIVA